METIDEEVPPKRKPDKGFTLVELLIVIVILGILATVTVFAVRGIMSTGETNACKADKKTLDSAAEVYHAKQGAYPADQAAMVSLGLIRSASTKYTYTLEAPGYTLTGVSPCT